MEKISLPAGTDMDLLILAGNLCLPDTWEPKHLQGMDKISPQILFAEHHPSTIR